MIPVVSKVRFVAVSGEALDLAVQLTERQVEALEAFKTRNGSPLSIDFLQQRFGIPPKEIELWEPTVIPADPNVL